MNTVYEFRRKPLESSATRRVYANRLVTGQGQTLFTGETRRGYATKPVVFAAAGERSDHAQITFGRNRRVAGSTLELKDARGALIARIQTGLVQSSWGGPAFPVHDGRDNELFRLVPAEKLVDGLVGSLGRWAENDLILQREATMIGYTGHTDPATHLNPATDLGKRLLRTTARLSAELGSRVYDTLRRKEIDRPEVCAARLTLLPAAGDIDPRLALAVLLFKVHFFELRTPAS